MIILWKKSLRSFRYEFYRFLRWTCLLCRFLIFKIKFLRAALSQWSSERLRSFLLIKELSRIAFLLFQALFLLFIPIEHWFKVLTDNPVVFLALNSHKFSIQLFNFLKFFGMNLISVWTFKSWDRPHCFVVLLWNCL